MYFLEFFNHKNIIYSNEKGGNMNRKPDIFKPKMENKNNNERSYYSFLKEEEVLSSKRIFDETPIDFINRISKSGSYIFNRDVIIETKNKKYETRIAGKLGNRIITLDNDSIDINDIVKIYEK